MRTADCFRSRCACASEWQSSSRTAASKPARINLLIFIRQPLKIYPIHLPISLQPTREGKPPSRHRPGINTVRCYQSPAAVVPSHCRSQPALYTARMTASVAAVHPLCLSLLPQTVVQWSDSARFKRFPDVVRAPPPCFCSTRADKPPPLRFRQHVGSHPSFLLSPCTLPTRAGNDPVRYKRYVKIPFPSAPSTSNITVPRRKAKRLILKRHLIYRLFSLSRSTC